MTAPFAVYRLRDRSGALLYIGQSANPALRLNSLKAKSPWITEVATIDVQWFSSRQEAIDAEAAAIRREAPRHNIQHSQTHRRPRREAQVAGRALGIWMERHGVSEPEMAARAGVSLAGLRRIVACTTTPNNRIAQRLSDATGGDLPYFVWGRPKTAAVHHRDQVPRIVNVLRAYGVEWPAPGSEAVA
jgi:hypothetical protein